MRWRRPPVRWNWRDGQTLFSICVRPSQKNRLQSEAPGSIRHSLTTGITIKQHSEATDHKIITRLIHPRQVKQVLNILYSVLTDSHLMTCFLTSSPASRQRDCPVFSFPLRITSDSVTSTYLFVRCGATT